jgi:hypothetical protein
MADATTTEAHKHVAIHKATIWLAKKLAKRNAQIDPYCPAYAQLYDEFNHGMVHPAPNMYVSCSFFFRFFY